MANPIIRGFSKLTQFSGRDTRGEFWPYAGVVVALVFLIGGMVGGVIMSRVVAELAPYATDSQVVIAPSDQILVEGVNPPPMPDLSPFFLLQGATLIVAIALLAAAVSRRLHDRGTPGWWGLMPVPFVVFGLVGFQQMFRSFGGGAPDFGLFGLLFLNNMAYLAALVTLIILLAQPGKPGPNRYGEAKATAPVQPVEDWSTPS